MALPFKPWKSFRHAAFVVAFVSAVVAVVSGVALVRDSGSAGAHVDAGTIQVHKYLPKDPPNASAPWQNQGAGQGAWTYSVYATLVDAQAGTNPIASFDQLGKNSPPLPLTELWLKETVLPAGQTFFGWFVPDGDGDSGNDKCNQQPVDGSTMGRDAILYIPAEYWTTKGNRTGLFHICAYNAPKTVRGVQVCKSVIANGDGLAVDAFAYGFDVRLGGATAVSGSNSAAEPNPDVPGGAASTPVCTSLDLSATQAFDVTETAGRPIGWADAPGFPRYSIDGAAPVEGSATTSILAGTTDVKVTFFNKAVAAQREIVITKTFANAGSYSPVMSDLPGFVLQPSEGTSCRAPVNPRGGTWRVTCAVPFAWDGTVSELPVAGWRRCQGASIVAIVAPPPASAFQFCNEPYGTIRIEKFDGVNGAGPAWAFTVGGNFAAPGGEPYASPVQASHGTPFVSGPIGLSATPVTVAEVLARPRAHCAVENTYYTIAAPPADTVIDTPGEVQTWTFQNVPCGVLGNGGVIIEKHLDINGDGDSTDPGEGPIAGWTFTTSGGGIPPASQVRQTDAAGQVVDYAGGFDAGAVLSVNESARAGYATTRVTLDGATIGTSASNAVVIIGGQKRVIRYYNQPKGSITVHKETYNVLDGVATRNFRDDDGWTIRLTSAACGVDRNGTTGVDGAVTFGDLPLCTDYLVTEDLALPGANGYSPVTPAWVAGVVPALDGGAEIVFINETRATTPPPPPPPPPLPPEDPTPTPTPVARIAPTSTPTPTPSPTSTPRPGGTVFGERTPGPATPTPIVPRTGGGAVGTVAGEMDLLLLMGAAVALCAGSAIVGFKHRK